MFVERAVQVMNAVEERELDAFEAVRRGKSERHLHTTEETQSRQLDIYCTYRLNHHTLCNPNSQSVEGAFSQAGLSMMGRKCNTGGKLLENKCLLIYNNL